MPYSVKIRLIFFRFFSSSGIAIAQSFKNVETVVRKLVGWLEYSCFGGDGSGRICDNSLTKMLGATTGVSGLTE